MSQLSDADYIRFRDLVRAKSGLEFHEARRSDLERAIFKVLVAAQVPTADDLYHRLTGGRADIPLLEQLLADLAVGETYFFRNRPQFDAIERYILPEVIDRRRSVRRLRLWSAGCASGEEPYSLAILLRRLLPDLAQWDVSILATDFNREALAKARRGVYSAWSFRGVPAEIQESYFSRQADQYAIAPFIQQMVTFAHLNLIEGVYPASVNNTSHTDLILFRNVLIYFNAESIRQVVGRMYDALTDGGWLVVGHAEPSQTTFRQFTVRNFPSTVVYQKSAAGDKNSDEETPTIGLAPDRPFPLLDSPPVLPLSTAPEQDRSRRDGRPVAPVNTLSPLQAARLYASRLELGAAKEAIQTELQRSPLSAPAHYLHGLILQEEGEWDAALDALRRCIYADPEFVMGHFALAGLYARLRQPARARKSLDNMARLLAGRPLDEVIPESDGITVKRLLAMAAAQIELGIADGTE
jgi:chemotaxis protein methyltransferase CheR